MAKFRFQLSETTNVEYSVSTTWWQQLKSFNLSPIFRLISWFFLIALASLPFAIYASWGLNNAQSAQLHSVALIGGAAIILLIAWVILVKWQHFADPPMFLGVLIFAFAQILILLTNTSTNLGYQLNTFGSNDTKMFAGVAIMALTAIFYGLVITANTARKRRLIGVALLSALALISLNIVVSAGVALPTNSMLIASSWLVATAILLGGYRRALLVVGIFVWLITTFQLFFGVNQILTLPSILVILIVGAVLNVRKYQINLRDGWREFGKEFQNFIAGTTTWPQFVVKYQARLWVVVTIVFALATVIYMLQPGFATQTINRFTEAANFISTEATRLSTIWQTLQQRNALFTGLSFEYSPQPGTILSILASTGILGMLAYAVLSGSAVYYSIKEWYKAKYATWAGLWWPVLLLLPLYNLAHKIDLTALVIWWLMFAHLSAIEQWQKQPKLYKVWETITFRNKIVSRPLAIAQIVIVILLIVLLAVFIQNLNNLLTRGVL